MVRGKKRVVLGDLSRTGGRNRALVGASFQVLPGQYLPILSNTVDGKNRAPLVMPETVLKLV